MTTSRDLGYTIDQLLTYLAQMDASLSHIDGNVQRLTGCVEQLNAQIDRAGLMGVFLSISIAGVLINLFEVAEIRGETEA